MLVQSLLAAVIISLLSLVGVFTLALKKEILSEILHDLIALAAGVLLGSSFFHLLPEALEGGHDHTGHNSADPIQVFALFLAAFAFFFILERFVHWRHCHKIEKCEVHPVGIMNLIGDGVHNLIDGVLIFAAFSVSFEMGIIVTLSVAFHEIPQEIGDFGVLVHSGYSVSKALFLNLITGLTAVLGVLLAYILGSQMENFAHLLLPITAGGFTYIAASDLVPELHTEKNFSRALISFVIFVLGLLLSWYLTVSFSHEALGV